MSAAELKPPDCHKQAFVVPSDVVGVIGGKEGPMALRFFQEKLLFVAPCFFLAWPGRGTGADREFVHESKGPPTYLHRKSGMGTTPKP